MHEDAFLKVIETIRAKDTRYGPDAYLFLREALDYTSKVLNKASEGPRRHVSGKELIDGIRAYALQEFGPLALTVLRSWGIRLTADFGEIVFNLVESGILGRTEQDRKEDFADGYDFYDAFARPFLPRARRRAGKSRAASARPPVARDRK